MSEKAKDSTEHPRPVSTLNWMLTIVLLEVPVINLPFYIYWGIAPWVNPNKKNYCVAMFMLYVLCVLLFVGLVVVALNGEVEFGKLSALVESLATESNE